MIEKLMKKLSEVTDKYTTIECKFSNMGGTKEKIEVTWTLYIADTVGHKHFRDFGALEYFVNALWIELKRVNTKVVENVVEIAEHLCLEQEDKK